MRLRIAKNDETTVDRCVGCGHWWARKAMTRTWRKKRYYKRDHHEFTCPSCMAGIAARGGQV